MYAAILFCSFVNLGSDQACSVSAFPPPLPPAAALACPFLVPHYKTCRRCIDFWLLSLFLWRRAGGRPSMNGFPSCIPIHIMDMPRRDRFRALLHFGMHGIVHVRTGVSGKESVELVMVAFQYHDTVTSTFSAARTPLSRFTRICWLSMAAGRHSPQEEPVSVA